MNIVTRIGRGAVQHAARFDPKTGEINLFCNSLPYKLYFAAITDAAKPTAESVSCKKCLKNSNEWSG